MLWYNIFIQNFCKNILLYGVLCMLKKAKNKLLAFLAMGGLLSTKPVEAERPLVESWADIAPEVNSRFSDLESTYSKHLKIPVELSEKFGLGTCRGQCSDCILLGKKGLDLYYAFHRWFYCEDENADRSKEFYADQRLDEIEQHIQKSTINAITSSLLRENCRIAKSFVKKDGISLFYSEKAKNGSEKIIEFPLCLPNGDESDLLIIGEKDGSKYVKQWPKWLTDYFSKIDENKKTKLVCVLAALGITSIPTGVALTKLLKNDEYVSNNRKMQEITDFEEEYDVDDFENEKKSWGTWRNRG